jgi:PAS domain S-box-containing protein
MPQLFNNSIANPHAEANASREVSRFLALFDSSPNALLLTNSIGIITYANQTAVSYFGYEKAELVGANVDMLVPMARRAHHVELRQGYIHEPRPRQMAPNFELYAQRKDGSTFPVEIGLSPIVMDDGLHVLATINDRSAVKHSQQSQAQLAALIAASGLGVVIHRLDGPILLWNRGAERLFGYLSEDMLGETIERIIPDDLKDENRATIERLASGQGVQEFETRRLHKDGSLVDVAITKSAVLDEHHRATAVVMLVYDITERMRASEAVVQRTRELARSNAELEQFAYVASHDLQEPLRMVTSYLQLLEQRYSGQLDNDADEFIAFAVDGALRMKQLITDLLSFSRAGRQLEPKPTSLARVLDNVLRTLAVKIHDAGAEVTSDPMPQVLGNEPRLFELLLNLIGNALKYRSDRPPRIAIKAQRSGAEWNISVADNGIGIAPEHHERVFAMFQRLHAAHEYQGTGIGLAICKRIVEQQGGRIWIESALGAGTTFHFTLKAA